MPLLKKLNLFQLIFGFFILINLLLFATGLFVNLKSNIFFLTQNYFLSIEILIIGILYLAFGIGNILRNREFINGSFIFIFFLLFLYGKALSDKTLLLPGVVYAGFYLTFILFIFSFIPLYCQFYEARIQTTHKISKFSINNKERIRAISSAKIGTILACISLFILPLTSILMEALWQFRGSNLELYGATLTLMSLVYMLKFINSQCNRDPNKVVELYCMGFITYSYGLFIILVFALAHAPLKITILPIVAGALLCLFSIVALVNIWLMFVYTNELYEAYDYKPFINHDILIEKIKRQIITGILIASFIAYELAVSLQSSINSFF